jgi:pilus assembly protein CpaB
VDGRVVEHVGGSALAAVEEGKRAVTIKSNDVIGVAVSALETGSTDRQPAQSGGERGTESRTLLQNLKVLAVDQTMDRTTPSRACGDRRRSRPRRRRSCGRPMRLGAAHPAQPLDGTRRERARPGGAVAVGRSHRPRR